MQLRPYQDEGESSIQNSWDNGSVYTLYVLPTGGGKTVIFSEVIKKHNGPSCAIAHRQELVSQMSLALARDGIRHKIIGPTKVVKMIVQLHMSEVGKSYYDPNSQHAVAGVDTLIRRHKELKRWCNSVTLWVTDEGHHLLKDNKWGKACAMFPNSKGLGVTATPERADGQGLGGHADGLYDSMIVGPSMRELINMGYLTDYRIFAPPSDLDLTNVTIGGSGEYTKSKLKSAVRKSHIIGDVVNHYLRIAPGKLGITFATDVETATDICEKFNMSGVPAAVVSAKTPDNERLSILNKFRNRELTQLVNVDLFGEGFDLPAIEVVSMARPTASYCLYVQQFGRACRLMDGKDYAIIIDHVGNVQRHGLPDTPRQWSLDRRERSSRGTPDDVIPQKSCPECTGMYERIYSVCPYCGYEPVPVERSRPEHVDGDLIELDAATLARMRGDIEFADRPVEDIRIEMIAKYAPEVAIRTAIKRHRKSLEMQKALRASIAWWGGVQRSKGYSDSESYKLFYFKFGIDVLTAQTLKLKEASILAEKINQHLGELI